MIDRKRSGYVIIHSCDISLGIAPFRAFWQNSDNAVQRILFFGCRDTNHLLYREELEALRSRDNFTIHIAFSREKVQHPCSFDWYLLTGLVPLVAWLRTYKNLTRLVRCYCAISMFGVAVPAHSSGLYQRNKHLYVGSHICTTLGTNTHYNSLWRHTEWRDRLRLWVSATNAFMSHQFQEQADGSSGKGNTPTVHECGHRHNERERTVHWRIVVTL